MSMLPSAFLLAAAAPDTTFAWPADSVVLVVAGWCAPCHAELRRLEAIAKAAGRRQVRVVGLDQSFGTRAMLARVPPAQRWQPPPDQLAALRQAVYAASAGLPYSVATDAAGHACADGTSPLDDERTRALTARCVQRGQDRP